MLPEKTCQYIVDKLDTYGCISKFMISEDLKLNWDLLCKLDGWILEHDLR